MHGEVILTKFFQGYYTSALRRYGKQPHPT